MTDPSPAHQQAIEAAMQRLFAGLERRAPGSEASSARALAMVPRPEQRRRVLELGCGSGRASLQLAAALPSSHIVAVDLDAEAIAALREQARIAGMDARIDARVADMQALALEAPGVDLIWAEGSLYAIGLGEGLALCRRLLAPAGVVVLTELVWLGEAEAEGARAFWAECYPQMRTREQLEAELREHELACLAAFVLPREDWTGYYDPLRVRLDAHSGDHDPGMREAIALLRREIDVFDRWGDAYGYLCVIAEALAREPGHG